MAVCAPSDSPMTCVVPVVTAVPDQIGYPRGRIRDSERRLGQAAAMFGQVGDEQMIVGKRLDLRLP